MNTSLKLFHSVNVVHPVCINISEKNHSLKLLEHIVAECISLILKALVTSCLKFLDYILSGKVFNIGEVVIVSDKPALVFLSEAVNIPILFLVAGKVIFNGFVNILVEHLKD